MEYEFVDYPKELKELLERIFSDGFMQNHTRFQTFEAFRYSSAVFVNWEGEQLIYPRVAFDNFVKESTNFDSWEEMVRAATDLCFPRPVQTDREKGYSEERKGE